VQIPNGEHAIVEDAKVHDYLLAAAHPIGRHKARVFVAVGYRRHEWTRLRDDLLASAATAEARPGPTDEAGQRWIAVDTLRTPSGALLPVRTVWLIPFEGQPPRFLTAYPERKA
jgi:hypothetical protein